MSVADLQLFQNEQFGKLRICSSPDGDAWFAAADVAKALGHRDANHITRMLDDDEKSWSGDVPLSEGEMSLDGRERKGGLRVINESGFYRAVLKSISPNAAPFQRWVTHEVLPSIRKDGGYIATSPEDSDADIMARALLIANKTIEERDKRITQLLNENRTLGSKASLYDSFMSGDGLLSIRDAAKLLKSHDRTVGQNWLTEQLRYHRLLEKRTRKATATAINRGYMQERMFKIKHKDGHETVDHYGCLTTKGLDWCCRNLGLHFAPFSDGDKDGL